MGTNAGAWIDRGSRAVAGATGVDSDLDGVAGGGLSTDHRVSRRCNRAGRIGRSGQRRHLAAGQAPAYVVPEVDRRIFVMLGGSSDNRTDYPPGKRVRCGEGDRIMSSFEYVAEAEGRWERQR